MKKLLVTGSTNTDMVVKSPRFPEPGETILGGEFFMFPGGKGANQAVAASRAGAEVSFIGRVGDDLFGKKAVEGLKAEGIDTSHIRVLPGATSGVALIIVNREGENKIVVAPGANTAMDAAFLAGKPEIIARYGLVLTQLETPLEEVVSLAGICADQGVPLILNPAPATQLPDALFARLYMITPNQSETRLLTGINPTDEASAERACQVLQGKGVREVIITLGKSGLYYSGSEGSLWIDAEKVEAVDTTAAGDVFNGILAACLAKGMALKDALGRANKGAALSVTRMGAQTSAPYDHEIQT